MGSGVGDPFGPRCNKGDIMGCGVLFPRDFESKSDSEEEGQTELMARLVEEHVAEAEEYETDSGEEEDWWRPEVKLGDKVQVWQLPWLLLLIIMLLVTGLLYKKWEDNWQKRCCSPSWRILPDCRHDEQAGEGEGGVEAAFGVVERSK